MLHTESLPNHQGIYTPLSQAMTDSESDEEIEIHNASKHRQQQQQQKQLQVQQQQSQQQSQQQTQLQQQSQLQLQQSQQQSQLQLQQQSQLQQQQPSQLQLQQQRFRSRIPPNTLALKSPHTRPTATRIVAGAQLKQQQQQQQQQQYKLNSNMQNTFRSVMLSDLGVSNNTNNSSNNSNMGVEFSNFNGDYDASADNVAILGNQTEQAKNLPMSTMRGSCFIASLLLCLFAVVGFVWLIPCGNADGTGACPAPVDRLKTHNWLNNYTKIELRGGVNVVSGLRAWENNLIFLYRGDVFFPSEFRPSNHKRNGIISLIGNSGAVSWYDETVDEPVAIDCSLLDVDSNGKPDCLVFDEYGELGAINSASGQWYWRFTDHSAHKLDAYDFPLILPDLDGDGVLDILHISSYMLEHRTKTLLQQPGASAAELAARNVLRLLSGRQGLPIGDGFRVHDCQQLSRLQLEAVEHGTSSISYSCWRNNTEQQRSKSLAELYALITNKSIVGQRLSPSAKIAQHRRHGQRRHMDAQRNVYTLSGRDLLVENRGKCPDCNVTFVLSETRDGKRQTLRNFTNSGMYGMVPAQWYFKNTKSKMSGFVIKFWKWHGSVKQQQQQQQQQHSSGNNSVDKSYNYTNSSSKQLNAIREKDKNKDKSYTKKKTQQPQQQRLKREQQQQHLEREQQHLKRERFKREQQQQRSVQQQHFKREQQQHLKTEQHQQQHLHRDQQQHLKSEQQQLLKHEQRQHLKREQQQQHLTSEQQQQQHLKRKQHQHLKTEQQRQHLKTEQQQHFTSEQQQHLKREHRQHLKTEQQKHFQIEQQPHLQSEQQQHSKSLQQQQHLQRDQQQHLQSSQQSRFKRAHQQFLHDFPAHTDEFDEFEHIMPIVKREAFTVHAKNQSKSSNNNAQTQQQLTKNYKMQMITETVILVLFIGADTRIENTSQSNIVQFCRNERNDEEIVCQPDLTNQENSMLIADLDQDGSQELVSYMSTFVQSNVDDPESDWKLVSYVRLLRLQSELPAYYDEEKRN